MSVAYDIRIKQSAWKQALQIYTDAKNIMLQEKNHMTNVSYCISQGWQGNAAHMYVQEMNHALINGRYDLAFQKVIKMRTMLENNSREIDKLLKRCELFENQLTSPDYVGVPDMSDDNMTIINGGYLSGNYSKLTVMSNLCGDICDEANSLKVSLNRIMENCSDLVPDAGACQGQVTEAYNKLYRVHNLQTSLNCYLRGLQGLEEDINVALKALMGTAEESGSVPENNYDFDIQKYSTIVEHLKKLGYSDEEIARIEKSVMSEEDKLFALNFFSGNVDNYKEAFKIDPDKLSVEMQECMAEHFLKCELFECFSDKAEDNYGVEVIQTIVNTLLYANPEYHRNLEFLHFHDDYIEVIHSLMMKKSQQDMLAVETAIAIGVDSEKIEKLIVEADAYFNQYSLWESINQIYTNQAELLLAPHAIVYGDAYFRISELEGGTGSNPDGNGAYRYKVEIIEPLKTEKNNYQETDYEDSFIEIVLAYPMHRHILNNSIDKQLAKLMKEQDELPLTVVKESLLSVAGMYPICGDQLEDILRNIFGDKEVLDIFEGLDYEEALGSIPEVDKYAADLGSDGMGIIYSLIGVYVDCLKRDKEIDALIMQHSVYNFGTYVSMDINWIGKDAETGEYKRLYDGIPRYIVSQTRSPRVVYKCSLLKQQGIDVYLNEVITEENIPKNLGNKSKEDYIKKLKNKLIDTFDGNPAGRAFLEGDWDEAEAQLTAENSSEITPQQRLEKIITEIENVIAEGNDQITPLGEWLNVK